MWKRCKGWRCICSLFFDPYQHDFWPKRKKEYMIETKFYDKSRGKLFFIFDFNLMLVCTICCCCCCCFVLACMLVLVLCQCLICIVAGLRYFILNVTPLIVTGCFCIAFLFDFGVNRQLTCFPWSFCAPSLLCTKYEFQELYSSPCLIMCSLHYTPL